jgi:beta-lactamase regulating signal transducer with metallopeptidase domain
MSPSLILYLLLVGALVTLSATAIDAAARRASLPTRWIWATALVALVVFAVVAPRRQTLTVELPLDAQVSLVSPSAPASQTSSVVARFQRGQQWAVARLTSAFTSVEARIPARVATAAALAWILTSGVVLLLLVVVHRRVDRQRRAWPSAELHGTRVRVAPLAGPAVIGVTRPEIVLPHWLLERGVDEQRLVIAHEREHMAARDHLLLVGAWIVAAGMPWHPAVWWMLSRLRLALELDCDARVLRRGVPARKYGLLLIDIAGCYGSHRMGALALADRTSHLERRLKAMTTTKSRFAAIRVIALGAVAALSLLAACEARLPTAAEVESMDAKSASKAAIMTKLIATEKAPVYYVNGKEVTETDASAIAADKIATVNIQKGTANGRGEIRIITRDFGGEVLLSKIRDDSSMVRMRQRSPVALKGELFVTKSDAKKGFTGLVYIDGKLASNATFESMNPESIKSVEVIKGAAAKAMSSDPAAENGIIRIITKVGGQ